MADLGHKRTDKVIDDLERRLAREYEQATREMEEKLRGFLKRFAEEDERQRKLVKEGVITQKDYEDWRFRHILMNKRWKDMRDTLAEDYHHTNQIAAGIYNGEKANIYALNHNYALYRVEHDGQLDTGLTIYNRDAVERILAKNPDMLPPPGKRVSKRIAEGLDVRWNNQQIQSVMVQGILQGESIANLARRLETVTEHNFTAAMRNARTMATGAQNAGRNEAYKRAESKGVNLVLEWQATLDGRTRHDHRMLHGVRIKVGEKFETPDGELDFPGDPHGPASQVYNCRCTTLSWVKGFEGETVKSSPKMWDMSFDEWQVAKAHPDTQADRDQYAEYRRLLGSRAPSSYNAFREMKYTDPEAWEELKSQAQSKRVRKRAKTENSSLHSAPGNSTINGGAAKQPEPKVKGTDDNAARVISDLVNHGVQYNEVKPLQNALTQEEIVSKICGEDSTSGSCMSLSLAYAGNRAGYDVRDFRGGKSADYFSRNLTIRRIANMSGVESYTAYETNDFKAAKKLLQNVQSGKEYILSLGEHAAIIRKAGERFEYLELQEQIGGFFPLTEETLRSRFMCRKSHSSYGLKLNMDSDLIEIGSLGKSDWFEDVLGYINTSPNN